MTSILHTYRREIIVPKEYRDDSFAGPSNPQHNRAVRINDETFSLMQSSLITGLNRHSSKRWYRWRETRAFIFSIKKKDANGKPQVRIYDAVAYPRKSFLDISSCPRSFGTVLADAPLEVQQMFCDFIQSRLGIVLPSQDLASPAYVWGNEVVTPFLTRLAYPGLSVFKHNIDYIFPVLGILSPGLREDTPIAYTRKLFAKKYYRKDLVKALAEAPLELHSRAVSSAGLIPTDWIIEGLRHETQPRLGSATFYTAEDRKTYREFLRAVPPALRRRYVLGHPDRGRSLVDVHRMLNDTSFDIDFRRYHSIDEIHTAWIASQRLNRDHAEATDTIPLNSQTEKLTSVSVPDFEIVSAKTRGDLIEWSNEMGNCIRGYYQESCQKDRSYLGVYYNGKLMANVEVVDGRVQQFLGKHNNGFAHNMPKVQPILNAWIDAKAIHPKYQSAWGLK